MRGPTNPSMNYSCGLLIHGFDAPPLAGTTYNPPYYAKLLEGAGFQKAQDMYAYHGHIRMLDRLDPKLAFIAREAKRRHGIRVRCYDWSRPEQEALRVLHMHNEALRHIWGFVPLSAPCPWARRAGLG